jgi:hypothetical protein
MAAGVPGERTARTEEAEPRPDGTGVDPNPGEAKKRGPKTRWTDSELVEEIRVVLQESDFLGEGHRKVRARLRAKGMRVGKNRVLRLMRENGLLAPVRRGHPRGEPEPQRADHDG